MFWGRIISQGYIGTGCKIETLDGTEYIYIVVPGDIDGSGTIASTDYIRIRKYFSGLPIM